MKEPASDLLNDRRRPPGRVAPYGDVIEVSNYQGDYTYVVDEPCKSKEGKWFCIPHAYAPHYQEEADRHNTLSCQWVWVCQKHVKEYKVETTAREGRKRGNSKRASGSTAQD